MKKSIPGAYTTHETHRGNSVFIVFTNLAPFISGIGFATIKRPNEYLYEKWTYSHRAMSMDHDKRHDCKNRLDAIHDPPPFSTRKEVLPHSLASSMARLKPAYPSGGI